jgi:hypothetical protein
MNWTTNTDNALGSLAIGSLAVDPSRPRTVYAGTGEQASCYDCLYGQGVYRTVDGGRTWSQAGAPPGGWGRATVSRIAVNPKTGAVLVAEGSGFYGGGGVLISRNGRSTWRTYRIGPGSDTSVSDLTVDAAGNVYAAAGSSLSSQAGNGIYECANPCTGVFTLIGGGPRGIGHFPAAPAIASIKVAVSPGSRAAIYAVASSSASPGRILGVYRLLPETRSWTRIAVPADLATYENQAWYDMYVMAAGAGTVYLGLSDIYRCTNAAGNSPRWTDLNSASPGGGTSVHPDQHAGAVADASRVFFGNDGGVWQLNPRSSRFTDRNGNLATLQFYGGSLGTSRAEGCAKHCDPTARIGGTQDNGVAQTDRGAGVWQADPGFADGGYSLIDPRNNYGRYAESAFGALEYSTDGGRHFVDAGVRGCGSSAFIAPMALDPVKPSTLFIGMRDLCMTPSAGKPGVWRDISGGVTRSTISAVAVSQSGGGLTIYISDTSGHTYFTTSRHVPYRWISMDVGNAGGPLAAIRRAGGRGPAPSWNLGLEITGIAADPKKPGTAYVTLNGFQGRSAGHVFKWTRLGGPHGRWVDISGNLPDEPYDTVAVNPANGDLYIGGISGVFVLVPGPGMSVPRKSRGQRVSGYVARSLGPSPGASQTLGHAELKISVHAAPQTSGRSLSGPGWRRMGTGLPNVEVDNLQVSRDGATLVAFTHGRSVWEIDLTANRGGRRNPALGARTQRSNAELRPWGFELRLNNFWDLELRD